MNTQSKPWLFSAVFWIFLFGSSAQAEIVDTDWIRGTSSFQQVYDELTANGYYAMQISGRLALFEEYRGVFTKIPSDDFTAYGYHGLTKAEYDDLVDWADAEGFLITATQSFKGFFGDPLFQVVMVYSGKFVPLYSDGVVHMPLVWVWNGKKWQSYYAELTVMGGLAPLSFYLSDSLKK
jgi:hypothetical protein